MNELIWNELPPELTVASVIKRGDGSTVQVLFTEEKPTNLVLRHQDWTLEFFQRPITPVVGSWYSITDNTTGTRLVAQFNSGDVFTVGDLTYALVDVTIHKHVPDELINE